MKNIKKRLYNYVIKRSKEEGIKDIENHPLKEDIILYYLIEFKEKYNLTKEEKEIINNFMEE